MRNGRYGSYNQLSSLRDADKPEYPNLSPCLLFGKRVYVLHAFQKKAPKGRKTSKLDVEMIVRRYKEAVEIEKEKLS